MSRELKAIEAALREPFACEWIKFKPKQPRQDPTSKRWQCLALPYADKRAYEDRLNEVAFGEWSTPYTPPIVAGNKLIIPVTVVLYEVAHTDIGEAFLSSTKRSGETREEENSATEAYSQAFRRACSQFGLGRYLYRLPKLWLPYDPGSRVRPIAISESERIAWVEKLYMQAGLPPRPKRVASASQGVPQASKVPTPSSGVPPQPAPSQPPEQMSEGTVDLIDAQLLAYIRRETTKEQQEKACHFYHVQDLAQLSATQALHLSDYIETLKEQPTPAGSRR